MNCRWLWREGHMGSQVGMMFYEGVKSSQVRLTKYRLVMGGQVMITTVSQLNLVTNKSL